MTALGLGVQQAIYMASLPSCLLPPEPSSTHATTNPAPSASSLKSGAGECQVSVAGGGADSGARVSSSDKGLSSAGGVGGVWRPTTQLLLITCSEHGRGCVTLPVVNPGTQARLKGKYLWDTVGLMNTLHTHGLHLSVATMQERSSLLRCAGRHWSNPFVWCLVLTIRSSVGRIQNVCAGRCSNHACIYAMS